MNTSYTNLLKFLPYHSPNFMVYDKVIYSSTGEYPYEDDNESIKPNLRCCANCIGSCGQKDTLVINNYKDISGMPLGSGCFGIKNGAITSYVGNQGGPRRSTGQDNNCAGFIPTDAFRRTTYKRLYIKLSHRKYDPDSPDTHPIVYQVHGRMLSVNYDKMLYKSAKDIYRRLDIEITDKIKEGFIIEILEHDGRKPVVRSIELRQKAGGKRCAILAEHKTIADYKEYCSTFRDEELKKFVILRDTFVESTEEEKHEILMGTVKRIGLSDILYNDYKNNVTDFMVDYFPDLTYCDFISIGT